MCQPPSLLLVRSFDLAHITTDTLVILRGLIIFLFNGRILATSQPSPNVMFNPA
jgi:hypothetical protein